jgi:hypothetical protein
LSVHPGLPPLEAKAILHRVAAPLRPDVLGSNVSSPPFSEMRSVHRS